MEETGGKNNNKKFKITLDAFNGPFDKLLLLIEKKKLEISKVSLADVTDDFVQYVKNNIENNNFDFKETSAFIYTASILLLIKSKALIPAFSLEEEEEVDIDNFEKKVKIYKIFSDISKNISDNVIFKDICYKKRIIKIKEIKFRPSENLDLKNLKISLEELVNKSPKKEKIEKKQLKKQLTLSEVITGISERIKTFLKSNFNELIVGGTKKEISVSFLAILELFRQSEIELSQNEFFGNIVVELKEKKE